MKLQESKGRYFVTIPKDTVKFAGWIKGQELAVVATGKGELCIKELKA